MQGFHPPQSQCPPSYLGVVDPRPSAAGGRGAVGIKGPVQAHGQRCARGVPPVGQHQGALLHGASECARGSSGSSEKYSGPAGSSTNKAAATLRQRPAHCVPMPTAPPAANMPRHTAAPAPAVARQAAGARSAALQTLQRARCPSGRACGGQSSAGSRGSALRTPPNPPCLLPAAHAHSQAQPVQHSSSRLPTTCMCRAAR